MLVGAREDIHLLLGLGNVPTNVYYFLDFRLSDELFSFSVENHGMLEKEIRGNGRQQKITHNN